jgi:hypothetical protein
LLCILFAQDCCGAHGQFGAWEFRENRIAHEFDYPAFIAPDRIARQCLKDFDQLQRAAFILRCALTVPRNVGKPKSDEMMG